MTKDDIIKMADEAGAEVTDYINLAYGFVSYPRYLAEKVALFGPSDLERFVALVEQRVIASGYRKCAVGQRTSQWCGQLDRAVAAERERCIQIARGHASCEGIAQKIEQEIREKHPKRDLREAAYMLRRQVAEIERLREALAVAEAALSDIGDAEREPGDDVAWCERRAAKALDTVRAEMGEAK